MVGTQEGGGGGGGGNILFSRAMHIVSKIFNVLTTVSLHQHNSSVVFFFPKGSKSVNNVA